MRRWGWLAAAVVSLVLLVGYAELVLDIRAPRSGQKEEIALGASAYLSLDAYNKKVQQMQEAYGERAKVSLDTSTGEMTVTVDGKVVERGQVARQFAAMYGLVVVTPPNGPERMFPFDIEPGNMPSGHDPTVTRLRARFGNRLPARYFAFSDAGWSCDACASPDAADFGFGSFARWLRLRRETFCVVRWQGVQPTSMLIAVNQTDGDPWMRPFGRRICRTLTTAALRRVRAATPPDYAACVLVDRPDRTGPTGAQDAFTAVVYEVRDGAPALMD